MSDPAHTAATLLDGGSLIVNPPIVGGRTRLAA